MLVAILRSSITLVGLLTIWAGIVHLSGTPPYILPGPDRVLITAIDQVDLLARHAMVTATEILLGLGLGTLIGSLAALALIAAPEMRRWLLPVLVASQAVPVFALAPLLVLWLGYGMASKVAMATLIIFFPVTASFYDGLRRTDPGWLDLARAMNAHPLAVLWHIRLPAALPALASGLRVATAVAPIGAVVGEWVGSSAGLGHLMLHANARLQTDVMFAALLVLAAMTIGLYTAVDAALRAALPWQPDHFPSPQSEATKE